MRSIGRSKEQPEIEIRDFYAMDPGSLWRGLKQESLAFWALSFYLAYEYLRPDLVYPAISFIPWGKLAILTACFGLFMDKSVKWVHSSATLPLALFFTVVFASCLTAFMPEESLRFISIPVNWVILYFLIISIVNSEKRFFLFLLVFFLVNFKMSQFGFRTFVGRGFTFTFWGVSGSPGWFQNGGDVALQMAIFTPMSMVFVYHLKQYWGRGKRIILYLMPFTALMTLVAASSRGALLAFGCVCAWYMLKTRLGIKTLFSILVMGVVLYQVLPQEMLDKFESSGEDDTSVSRLALWETGIDAALDRPLLGVGFENWFEFCWRNNPEGLGRGQWCLDLHNTYVEAAAETGFTGLFLYVLLNLKAFTINAKSRKNAKKLDNGFILYMTHALDAGLVGYVVASVFVSVLFYPVFWVHLAMIVALHGVTRQMVGAQEEDADTSPSPRLRKRRSMTDIRLNPE